MIQPSAIEILGTSFFLLAVLHTFAVSRFQALATRYPSGSIGENAFHLLGEVEVVFGLWAGVFILSHAILTGYASALTYAESMNFTEPLFVFAIMAVAATKPIVHFVRAAIIRAASLVPGNREVAIFACCLIVGPLLGSFVTEPAAMTVTALILKERYFDRAISVRMKYLTLAVLFVNISIGGVLTNFSAPPVLMVAGTWGWGLSFMVAQFGWKAIIAVLINTGLASAILRNELRAMTPISDLRKTGESKPVPWGLTILHLIFLAAVVFTAHHPVIFVGLLLFFLGVVTVTREYQAEMKLKESLLVGFFLAGLVVLGAPQKWWLEPVIAGLNQGSLFLSATFLTAFTDNAAITYLGAQIPGITDPQKYALVAGALAGGGLTVIANAPNPAGYTILRDGFGDEGIKPMALLLYSLVPTFIAMACFWFL